MLKKNIILALTVLALCGCETAYRLQMAKPAPLEEKDAKNAVMMAQLFGNKYDVTVLLDREELEFALQYREYFAKAVKMQGVKTVAVPFTGKEDADIDCSRGREMYDFVMYLNSESLKVIYLLRESHYINREKGNRFVWRKGNPYRAALLQLKEFWRELPKSAELPTVMIGIEMNRWDDKNVDRPAGLLFTWRKERQKKGSLNDMMFLKSMKYFEECCEILDLEQKILLVDEEVMTAGEKGFLTGGSVTELLKKCDALAVNMEPQTDKHLIKVRMQYLKNITEKGCIFTVVSPGRQNVDNYKLWLENMKEWQSCADSFSCTAGLWICDWNKINKIWRRAK